MVQDKFFLSSLTDQELLSIIELSEESLYLYICELIKKFFPSIKEETKIHNQLTIIYKTGFFLEYLFRKNRNNLIGFTPIYTKTGLIKEISNDLFLTNLERLQVH